MCEFFIYTYSQQLNKLFFFNSSLLLLETLPEVSEDSATPSPACRPGNYISIMLGIMSTPRQVLREL